MPWRRDRLPTPVFLGFPGDSDGKESAWNVGDLGSISGLGRCPGEQPTPEFWPGEFHGLYSPRVAKSQTWLSSFHFHLMSHTTMTLYSLHPAFFKIQLASIHHESTRPGYHEHLSSDISRYSNIAMKIGGHSKSWVILEKNPSCGSRNFRDPQSLAGVDGSWILVWGKMENFE